MRITIYSPYAHPGPNVTVQINQMRVTWRVHHPPLLFPKTCREALLICQIALVRTFSPFRTPARLQQIS